MHSTFMTASRLADPLSDRDAAKALLRLQYPTSSMFPSAAMAQPAGEAMHTQSTVKHDSLVKMVWSCPFAISARTHLCQAMLFVTPDAFITSLESSH